MMRIGENAMNSTNNTNSSENLKAKLATEKQKIFDIAKSEQDGYKFPVIDNDSESYFVNYETSKHLDSALTIYESGEFSDFSENLSKLWQNDAQAKKFTPALLAAYRKSKTERVNTFTSTDLYNYMM